MRIGYFGVYDTGPGYPRNDILIQALREAGHSVFECRPPPSRHRIPKWRTAQGPHLASVLLRRTTDGWRLRRRWARAVSPELWVVGAGAIGDVLRLRRWVGPHLPIVLDAFLPLVETLVEDRRLWPENGLRARALARLERRCLAAADLVLTDTAAHAQDLSRRYGLPADRFFPVPVGSRLEGAAPDLPPTRAEGPPTIIFIGTYIPLHGVEVILEASQRLALRLPHRLVMIGTGQTMPALRAAIPARHIEWVDRFVDEAELRSWYRQADLALGIFGRTPKAGRVVPCKVYDALAQGIPVLTRRSPALSEWFEPTEVADCDPEPEALARSMEHWLTRRADLARLAAAGTAAFLRTASRAVLGERLAARMARLGAPPD